MAVSGAGNRPIVQVTGGQGASTATALRDEILGLLAAGPDDALVQRLNRDNVTSLDLTGAKGQIGKVEMERLANALCKTNISRLSLEDCGLSDECYWEIGLLVRASPQLVELNLSHNHLGLDTSKSIGVALERGSVLSKLDLSHNDMNGNAFLCIMTAVCRRDGSEPPNNKLKSLDFSGNGGGRMFGYWYTTGSLHIHHKQALAELGPPRHLTSLGLSDTGLDVNDQLVEQLTGRESKLNRDRLFGSASAGTASVQAAEPTTGPYEGAMKLLGVPASTAKAFHEAEPELARLFEKYFCGDKPSLAIDLTGAVSCSRRLPYGEIAATCKRFAACAKAPSIRIAEVILIAQACSLFHNGNFGLVGQSLTLLGTILSANPGHAMSLAPWNEAVRLLGLLEVRIPGLAAEYAQPKEIISRAKPVAATSKVTTGSLTTTVTSTTTATTTVTTPAAATGPRPKTDVPFEVRERIHAEYLLQPGGGIRPAAT